MPPNAVEATPTPNVLTPEQERAKKFDPVSDEWGEAACRHTDSGEQGRGQHFSLPLCRRPRNAQNHGPGKS
jgi:hypothetical protein